MIDKRAKIFAAKISGSYFWDKSEVVTSKFFSFFEVNLNFAPLEKPKVSYFPEEILLGIAGYLKNPSFSEEDKSSEERGNQWVFGGTPMQNWNERLLELNQPAKS